MESSKFSVSRQQYGRITALKSSPSVFLERIYISSSSSLYLFGEKGKKEMTVR
jgi:hypothetical protein